jgi:hypothetical protein
MTIQQQQSCVRFARQAPIAPVLMSILNFARWALIVLQVKQPRLVLGALLERTARCQGPLSPR